MYKYIQYFFLIIISFTLSGYVSSETLNNHKNTFSDISQEDNFYAAITYSKEKGIVNGYSDGEFKQWELVSRYEFAKVIVKAIFTDVEIDKCDESMYSFPDVLGDAQQKFGKYVCMAKKFSLIKGFSSGFYEGSLPIKSEEAMKVIAIAFNLAKAEDEDTTSPDKLKPFVVKLSELKSVPTTIEYPDKKLQRGEMVEIIYRIKNNITNKEFKNIDEIYSSKLFDGEIFLENNVIDSSKMVLNWSVSETLNTENGFKIVKGISENPTYPGSAIYIEDGTTRKYEYGIPTDGIYFVRVCRYLPVSNSCDSYSNNIKMIGKGSSLNIEGSIKLFNSVGTGGNVVLEWQPSSSELSGGFKIVYSSITQYPEYPKDSWIYIDNSTIRRKELTLEPGKVWYLRVCKYNTSISGCDYYSNMVKVDLGTKETTSTELTAIQIYGIGSIVKWKANATPKTGVKVVWSKSEKPTYPPRGTDRAEFRADGIGEMNLNGFDGSGDYFVRVCNYVSENGTCNIYSNQVTLTLN